MLRQYSRTLAAILMVGVLSACTTFGIPKAETFNQRVAAAYTSVTSVRQTATILLQGNVITAADAQNVQNQADNARTGLDLAKSMHGSLPKSAEDRLSASLVILQTLQTYLDKRQKETAK
jgi:hypothetical protein